MPSLKYWDGENWILVSGGGVDFTESVGVDTTSCDIGPADSSGSLTKDGAEVDGVQPYKLNLTLPRGTVVTESGIEPPTAGACVGDLWIDPSEEDGVNGGDGTPPVQAGGRLTLDADEPVAREDMISSTLHYVPYVGDTFSVYDSSISLWVARKCPALSLDVSSLAANTVHDIFISYVSDSWMLSALAWADDRTRATELQRVDGIATNGANVSQRLIGTIKTNGTSQIEYTDDNRCVWNAYNQVQSVVQTRWYKTIAYDAQTWIPYGGSTTNGQARVSFVVGIPTPIQMTSNITQRFLYTGVVLDDLSEPWNAGAYSGTPGLNGNTTGGYITTPAIQSRVSPPGYNFVQACVYGFNSSSGAEDMLVQGVYMA